MRIHMNGRAYDYNLGRFLSVDPFIQEPGNSQSMNPYSYIMNNPLAGTDPTGYKSEGVDMSGCVGKTSCSQTVTVDVSETGSKIKKQVDVEVTMSKDADGNISFSGTMADKNGFEQKLDFGTMKGKVDEIGSQTNVSNNSIDSSETLENGSDTERAQSSIEGQQFAASSLSPTAPVLLHDLISITESQLGQDLQRLKNAREAHERHEIGDLELAIVLFQIGAVTPEEYTSIRNNVAGDIMLIAAASRAQDRLLPKFIRRDLMPTLRNVTKDYYVNLGLAGFKSIMFQNLKNKGEINDIQAIAADIADDIERYKSPVKNLSESRFY